MSNDTWLVIVATIVFCLALYLAPRWRHWLYSWLLMHVDLERPSFVIGSKDRPYMKRWWIIPRNRFFNIYLHNVLRDDDDRALHDHPWPNMSIVLAGGYWEVTPDGRFWRAPGSIRLRSPWARHRLELDRHEIEAGFDTVMNISTLTRPARPAWSLFVTGPNVRNWGFWCKRPDGTERFVPWQDFVHPNDPGLVGPGCDQPGGD